MKKILLVIFTIITFTCFGQVKDFELTGVFYVKTDSMLIIGEDTIRNTTQISSSDDTLVTRGYLRTDFDSVNFASRSDTATVALRTQNQTNIIRVDQTLGRGDFTTIQAAINAANDSLGVWQIQISEGTYNEQLTLYDSIQLVGIDDDMVTITSVSPVLTMADNKSAIRDVTIEATTTGAAIVAANTSSTSELKIQNTDINVVDEFIDISSSGFTTLIVQDCYMRANNSSTAALTSSAIKLSGNIFTTFSTNFILTNDNRLSGEYTLIDCNSTQRSIYSDMLINVTLSNASYSDNFYYIKANGSNAVDVISTINNIDISQGSLYYVYSDATNNAHIDISASDVNFDQFGTNIGVSISVGDTLNLNIPSVNTTIPVVAGGHVNSLYNEEAALKTNVDIIDENMFIEGSTNNSLNDFFNIIGSAGWVSGGGITVTSDSTLSIASGYGLIRESNNSQAVLKMFDFADTTNLLIPMLTGYYVYVDYNSGSPVIKTTTNQDLILQNENDRFELYEVIRESDTIHYVEHFQKASNVIGLIQRYLYTVEKIRRSKSVGGLIINGTGTRNVILSAGQLLLKLNFFDIDGINTSTGDTFDRYYRDGSGGFIKTTGNTQVSNTQYDDGTGTLATLGASKYSYQDFWIETDGALVSMYGQATYTSQSLALNAPRISNTPERISEHGLYVGRAVVEQGSDVVNWYSAFVDAIGSVAAISEHNDLGGLNTGNFQHLTPSELAYVQNFADSVASVLVVELNTAHRLADGDLSATNELNTSVSWDDVTNTISVTDAGGTKSDIIDGFLEENDLSGIRDSVLNNKDSLIAHNTRLIALEGQTAVTSFEGRTGAVVSQSGDYTTTEVTEGTNQYFTNERAQDAVGNNFVATGSVTPFYNDITPDFSWSVVPGGVDHDALLNYVSGEHLDSTELVTDYELDTTYNSLSADISSISGDYVSSTSLFGADNRFIKTDGTGRGVQSTGITIDDSDNITGVGDLSAADITASGDVMIDFTNSFKTDFAGYGFASVSQLFGYANADIKFDIDNNNNATDKTFKITHNGNAEDLLILNEAGQLSLLGKVTGGADGIEGSSDYLRASQFNNSTLTPDFAGLDINGVSIPAPDNIVTIDGAQTITGVKTLQNIAITDKAYQLAGATENNALTIRDNVNGVITINALSVNSAIRKAIRFDWYDTDYQIGNIRGSGADSRGFGVTKSNNELLWRVHENEGMHSYGDVTINSNILQINSNAPRIRFTETEFTPEWTLIQDGGVFSIRENYTTDTRFRIKEGGNVTVGLGSLNSEKLNVEGNILASGQFISTATTGTAPIVTPSTTLVANLNSDLLDGQEGTYYLNRANHAGQIDYDTDIANKVQFADEEIPSGSIDGVNDTFTIANTPEAGSVKVYLNGVRQRSGVSYNYTISGVIITFNAGNIPQTGDWLIVDYRY